MQDPPRVSLFCVRPRRRGRCDRKGFSNFQHGPAHVKPQIQRWAIDMGVHIVDLTHGLTNGDPSRGIYESVGGAKFQGINRMQMDLHPKDSM